MKYTLNRKLMYETMTLKQWTEVLRFSSEPNCIRFMKSEISYEKLLEKFKPITDGGCNVNLLPYVVEQDQLTKELDERIMINKLMKARKDGK